MRPSRLERRSACVMVLAALLAAGCQVPPLDVPAARPVFRMQAAIDGAPEGNATPTQIAGASAPSAAATGVLVVRLDGLLAKLKGTVKRSLRALEDVETVTVRLRGPGVDRLETVTAAMLAGGTTSLTFTGLPPGDLVITLEAFDAGGRKLGEDVRTATVAAGAPTTVETGALVGGPVPAAPTGGSGGSGGSGGAGGPSTTGIRAAIGIADGAPVRRLEPAARYFAGYNGPDVQSLALAKDGCVWVARSHFAPGGEQKYAELFRLASSGTVTEIDLSSIPYAVLGALAFPRLVADPVNGKVYFGDTQSHETFVTAYEADGSNAWSPGFRWSQYFSPDFTVDASGRPWILMRVDGAWRPQEGFAWPDPVDQGGYVGGVGEDHDEMRFDPTGHLWIAGRSRGPGSANTIGPVTRAWVRCVAPDGTVATEFDVAGQVVPTFALTGQGDAWLLTDGGYTLQKVSRTGAVLAVAASGIALNRLVVGPDDEVWAYRGVSSYGARDGWWKTGGKAAGPDEATIARFGPDGALRAYYHPGVGADLTELVVSPDGILWAGTGLNGLLKLPIDIPFAP